MDFRSGIWCWSCWGWQGPYITVLPLCDVQCLGECKVTHSGFQVGDLVLELEGVDVTTGHPIDIVEAILLGNNG